MKHKLATLGIFILCMFIFTATSSACHFFFNHEKIEAALGISGTVAVRVYQDHSDCTLEGDLDGYFFEWQNIQIIDSTDWKEISDSLYERSFSITLSQVGTGYFRIYKDCTREGYDDSEIPIVIRSGSSIWDKAFNGTYPYPSDEQLGFIKGEAIIEDHYVVMADQKLQLPPLPKEITTYSGEIAVHYSNKTNEILLMVSPEFYYRLD